MWRVVLIVAVISYIVYMFMALLQSFGLIKFSNRKITTLRMLIPFYYWIAPINEKSTNKPNKNKHND